MEKGIGMSRSLNKVMLIGNVGKNPELRHTASGTPFASILLATSENWRDAGGVLKEQTDWHNIVAWRRLADIVNKIVVKGARIYVEGKIQSRAFTDKNGNKKYKVEIVADNILMLDSKKFRQSQNDSDVENYDADEFDDSDSFANKPRIYDNKDYNDKTDDKDNNVDTFLF